MAAEAARVAVREWATEYKLAGALPLTEHFQYSLLRNLVFHRRTFRLLVPYHSALLRIISRL
jgi:hypothetical protein